MFRRKTRPIQWSSINYAQDPKKFASYCDNILEIVRNNDYAEPSIGFKPFAEGNCYVGQTILFDEFCGIGYEKEKTEKGRGYGEEAKGVLKPLFLPYSNR